MRHPIKLVMLATLGLLVASFPSIAAPLADVKTSQHASFKPRNFERLAVIVKPISEQSSYGMGMASRRGHQQSQLERLVEQGFMRTLLAHGYTLVSRTDLDAAMVEKGLDQAKLTDEKLNEEAAKLLHVPALLVVSVDAFSVTARQAPRQPGAPGFGGGQQYFQLVASVEARLVRIDDNMVMWTGDLTVDSPIATKDQDSVVLGSMAQAIAAKYPPFPAQK